MPKNGLCWYGYHTFELNIRSNHSTQTTVYVDSVSNHYIYSVIITKCSKFQVAGSNGFYNYRHQADICHSYHIVRSHGIAEENIVVMMYDDIANNSQLVFGLIGW